MSDQGWGAPICSRSHNKYYNLLHLKLVSPPDSHLAPHHEPQGPSLPADLKSNKPQLRAAGGGERKFLPLSARRDCWKDNLLIILSGDIFSLTHRPVLNIQGGLLLRHRSHHEKYLAGPALQTEDRILTQNFSQSFLMNYLSLWWSHTVSNNKETYVPNKESDRKSQKRCCIKVWESNRNVN